ncbi:heat shock protein 75 kDa, mitochondrial-like [Centruroides sculpturatus]|uniref:heat shock protein 75 kDa, mitochondrial-like n=1 Tax=Centruroides sculpturatus TaxID=218467 RepID=UPI000C6E6495|nr:heat shock protein 75 kDa, mitochondrial-like [Centruroides sculpturatus]
MAVSMCRNVFGPKLKNFIKIYSLNSYVNVKYARYLQRQRYLTARHFTTYKSCWSQQEPATSTDYHSIIKDTEKAQGESDRREFQAETRMLLDIVAKSLYSEKEVFIRELISNASDALEKLRYNQLSSSAQDHEFKESNLEIHIATDKLARTFTIQDTGVGMTKEEMIDSLGTIARSGSKEFLQQLKNTGTSENIGSIIGQFGVGFYSTFMVADKVEVYSRSYKEDAKSYKWTSDGSGTYEICEADGVQNGTKIVLHLKRDCEQFSNEDTIKDVIRKYSNFVCSPIYLNGKRINTIQALWLMDPKEVTTTMHEEFYRFVSNSYDVPRYWLHYKTDAPINIRCLLYVPEGKPGLFELQRDSDVGVALYSRRILIKNKAEMILPKWLKFVKGVVDSEDIPLNLSRELLQDSALIRKIRTVITNRLLRHLVDQMRKDPEGYRQFYSNYNMFLKEGIVSSQEQIEKEEIAKLMQFESSLKPADELVTLPEYCSRMKEGQQDIYYLAAPSRQLAENSPYFEAIKKKDIEVLFCYEPYDELVLMQLRQFDRKSVTSVEKEMRREKEDATIDNLGEGELSKNEANELIDWLKATLKNKTEKIKITKRLSNHPCLISVEDMATARHFVRASLQSLPEEQKYKLLAPTLEVNLGHPIMKKLSALHKSDPKLAELLSLQLMDNAMVSAGLVDDPRKVTTHLNDLLTALLEKH